MPYRFQLNDIIKHPTSFCEYLITKLEDEEETYTLKLISYNPKTWSNQFLYDSQWFVVKAAKKKNKEFNHPLTNIFI